MTELIEKLREDTYTTQQVAQAVGRTPQHWCRIRRDYIARYKLPVVKIGRRYYYKKEPVDRMIESLLRDGDN